MKLTYKYRVKDGGSSTRRALRAQARAVNFVWNYCCDVDRKAVAKWRAGSRARRPTGFDLGKLTTGLSREIGLHSQAINAVCMQFAASRDAMFPRTPRFRSYRRNLDWIPVTAFPRSAKFDHGSLTFFGRKYRVWHSRPLPAAGTPKSWNFNCDRRGRWYVNIIVDVPEADRRAEAHAVGIDLGIKTFIARSDGRTIASPSFMRRAEHQLAQFQRRRLKSRVRNLHAKVANQRHNFLHQASTEIVRSFDRIVVGNVSADTLDNPNLAKHISDAGWSAFRSMLRYKAIAHGVTVQIVDEWDTTRTRSCCGSIPDSSPKGKDALGIRRWKCTACGAAHDRDVNAACNILLVGLKLQPLAGENPLLRVEAERRHSSRAAVRTIETRAA